MKSKTRVIITGSLGYFVAFITQSITYVTGIRDQGGTLSDVDPISIALFALSSLGAGVAALMTLLAEPPKDRRLVSVESDSESTEAKHHEFTREPKSEKMPHLDLGSPVVPEPVDDSYRSDRQFT